MRRFDALKSSLWRRLFLVAPLALLLHAAGCNSRQPKESDANRLFTAASEHLAAGEEDQALEALNDSIASQPTTWALFERAKLLSKKGRDAEALEDCRQALELDSTNTDILWLRNELQKPSAQRFQGKFKTAPSVAGHNG
jgi:tetratricopeptide (TPR) repeat protein